MAAVPSVGASDVLRALGVAGDGMPIGIGNVESAGEGAVDGFVAGGGVVVRPLWAGVGASDDIAVDTLAAAAAVVAGEGAGFAVVTADVAAASTVSDPIVVASSVFAAGSGW